MSVLKLSENEDEFSLTGEEQAQPLELEASPMVAPESTEGFQGELFLPETNPEQPPTGPQIEFEAMPKPRYQVALNGGRTLYFQHAQNLLESLEAQGADPQYQCREGYCGSCRVELIEGDVYYYEEPLAFINSNEILTCCCIPKTDLTLKL